MLLLWRDVKNKVFSDFQTIKKNKHHCLRVKLWSNSCWSEKAAGIQQRHSKRNEPIFSRTGAKFHSSTTFPPRLRCPSWLAMIICPLTATTASSLSLQNTQLYLIPGNHSGFDAGLYITAKTHPRHNPILILEVSKHDELLG